MSERIYNDDGTAIDWPDVRRAIRARRDEEARKRMGDPHVEFCTDCGKPCDRTGRRSGSKCVSCSRKGARS